jgi:hypothetical protein
MADPFDYIESRADADELIQEFGQSVVITRTAPGTGPAWDPGDGTTATTNTFAVRVEYTMKQIQAGGVLANAERWLVATNAGALASLLPQDKVGDRDVLDVKPLQPAGVVVLFDCQVRK